MTGSAFSRAIKVRRSCAGITGQHVLHFHRRAAAEGVKYLLMQEMRQIADLLRCEVRTGFAALQRMTFGEKWSKGAPITIMQDGERTDQVCALLARGHFRVGAASLIAVASDAFGYINHLS